MAKETKKISTEVAIGIILIFSIIVVVAVYRAGSFSAAVNYIPQKIKKDQSSKQPERVLFATNGSKEIYKVKKDDGKWAVIIDGQEGEAYDEVLNPAFSDDGEQFAYSAIDEGEAFIVLNNNASEKKYKAIGQVIFNKDGVLIYKVVEDGEEFLVIGDKEGQHYTSIGNIIILDDGRVAFQAELDGKQVTVIDGKVVDNGSQDQNSSNQGNSNSNTNSSSDSKSSGNSSSGGSSSTTTTNKSNRTKKDLNIPTTEKSFPVCTGNNCNF